MNDSDQMGVGQRWIDDWKRRADKLFADTEEMAAKMDGLRVTATNPDENVRVTVNSAGMVEDLRLRDSIRDRPADEIAGAILTTMRKAQERLAHGAQQVVRATVGEESETGKAALAGFRRRFSAGADGTGAAR